MSGDLPLLFVTPLADQRGALGALALRLETPQNDAWLPLADDFSALAELITCRFIAPDGLPEALSQSLIEATILPLAPDDVDLGRDALPPQPGTCRWFAGRWYLAPPAKPSAEQVASRTLALKLIQLVSEDADTFELESVLRQDPSLAYHLLRLVNSPGVSVGREITNFTQAILILGRDRLRRWLNLLLFATRKDDPRAPMLLIAAAVRGRLMENLAKQLGHHRRDQDRAFMVGLFSLIGVLFGLPLPEVLRPLRITDEMLLALLHQTGPLGELLKVAIAAETTDPGQLASTLAPLPVRADEFNPLLLESYRWVRLLTGDISRPGNG